MNKKYFFFLLLILITNVSFSQYLKGKVVDTSNQPLPSATVYYDGTTLSTLTDENGEFALAYNPKLNRPLVFSYIGYQTVFLEKYSADEKMLITLDVAVNALREVVIKKDRFSRNEKMMAFKERFLGTTPFGKKTIIQNENDIEFEYDEKTFMLKAYSDKPLVIINPALGYKITYELVDFEIRFSQLTANVHGILQSYYAGLSRYEDLKVTPKTIKNRDKAYKGSSVHFFRSLVNQVWEKDVFQLFENGQSRNPLGEFTVTVEDDKYKVTVKKQKFNYKTPENLVALFGLLYDKKDRSQIQFNAESIFIDAYGNNLSLRDVSYSGAMSVKCVGDMVPLNYGIE